MTTHLSRLLFAQGGQCFFCRKPLPTTEASVEHLVAVANGGTNDDGNCVACCKPLNHLLGSKSIKDKLQIVLNQRGNFQCPGNLSTQIKPGIPTAPQSTTPATANPPISNQIASTIDLVVSDLKKRGASRPRKIATLTGTIQSFLKQQKKPNSNTEVNNLIAELQKRGKLIIDGTKVSYKLG